MPLPGLNSANVPPRVQLEAIQQAFTLVHGWEPKTKGAIGKALEDLKKTAEHNQAVYDQASEALQDLSAREDVLRTNLQTNAALMADIDRLTRTNKDKNDAALELIVRGTATLKRDTETLKAERARRNAEMDDYHKKLIALKTDLEATGRAQEAEATRNANRSTLLSARESHMDGIANDLRAILGRMDRSI